MKQKVSFKYKILVIISLLIGVGIGFFLPTGQMETYIPPLNVTGDVDNPFVVKDEEEIELVEISYKETDYQVYKLQKIVEMAVPFTEEFDLYLVGNDGLTARLSGSQLEKCYLNYSSQNGWEAINLHHPVSTNIKELDKIIVSTKGELPESALRVITPEENKGGVTPGQLLTRGSTIYPDYEGSATFETNGIAYWNEIYTRKNIVSLEEVVGHSLEQRTLVIGARGETLVYKGGLLEIKDNQLNYFNPENSDKINDVRGIILNTPLNSNQDIFYDTVYYLEKGEKVLIILLDGYGFEQYLYSLNNGYVPYLKNKGQAQKALSVFRPVTNAGLAATLTGVGPQENGVYSRKQKDLKSPDIFQKARELGKESIYLEGNIKILNTTIEPVLNTDLNQNGRTDDEVYKAALTAVNQDYSLIYLHFHGIDDLGHQYGPLATETMEMIKITDSYIHGLVDNWSGKVLITADHGMHTTDQGGSHGMICYEDLFVPYIIIEGGQER